MTCSTCLGCAFSKIACIIFKGISKSLDMMPMPENIVLRLLMSDWLTAPTNGAEIR